MKQKHIYRLIFFFVMAFALGSLVGKISSHFSSGSRSDQNSMENSRPSSASLSSQSENWGLGFQEKGTRPTGNASIEELKKYNAWYADDTDEKKIYLTFDAGYDNGNTPAILDALHKHQVYATFFVVGTLIREKPELIREIVTKVSHAVKKPVTAKIRIGFEGYPVDPVEIAKIIEDSGAAAVAVHGRTRQQYYAGEADWDTIRRIKEAVSIPVIGNGDVDSPKKAEALVRETGCDGIMIGRAVRGNPWIFREMNHYFTTGELLPRPSWEEIREMIIRHARMQIELKGEFTGIREMRKHIAWYTSGMRHSAGLRRDSNLVSSYEELEKLLDVTVQR